MKVIVAGWRLYPHVRRARFVLAAALSWAWAANEHLEVVHGDANGLDTIMRTGVQSYAADGWDIGHTPYPADWGQYGKSAGPRRNGKMWADHHADTDLFIGFPGPPDPTQPRKTSGTENCLSHAVLWGCPTWWIPWDEPLPRPPKARLVPETMTAR